MPGLSSSVGRVYKDLNRNGRRFDPAEYLFFGLIDLSAF